MSNVTRRIVAKPSLADIRDAIRNQFNYRSRNLDDLRKYEDGFSDLAILAGLQRAGEVDVRATISSVAKNLVERHFGMVHKNDGRGVNKEELVEAAENSWNQFCGPAKSTPRRR